MPEQHCRLGNESHLEDEHALLAAFEARPTRQKRTSSERSKEFRAKRKKYEQELSVTVEQLRREVAELDMRRNIWQEKLVHMRDNHSGAMIKLVRELYFVLQHGIADEEERAKSKFQMDYIRRVVHPEVQNGDVFGIDMVIDGWKRFTKSHSGFFIEVGEHSIAGPEEDPTVLLRSKLHGRFNSETFPILFPIAASDESLVARCLNRPVTYECLSHFRFTSEGQICYYQGDVFFAEGLLEVTGSLRDVEKMMRAFEDAEEETRNGLKDLAIREARRSEDDDTESDEDMKKKTSLQELSPSQGAAERKLSMNFLLS
ncbi:hypothetical protein Poli38472_014419 [Pythium oligandrum]|uniref:BZIP domain-containing protein n=1 Tax=Pythium oligandrum TaxID=41045 RepID=A0A8K1C727_PYTOL|nr:hypothetical protein Poli38472_014419 [Pythium oligandrum]|eukprot:TMW57816.1 hypothetical protein Poli38472_014419 [Pythium oligandrum]